MVMVLPDTAVTCVFATAPPSPAAPGSGVFEPMLGPVTHMPTVTPAKDGTVFEGHLVEPAGVSAVVVAVNVVVGGLMRWV